MSRDSFEILRIYIPLSQKQWDAPDGSRLYGPINNADTEQAWQQAEKLAKEGWDLIGTVSLAGSSFWVRDSGARTVPYTMGYILLFKRRISG